MHQFATPLLRLSPTPPPPTCSFAPALLHAHTSLATERTVLPIRLCARLQALPQHDFHLHWFLQCMLHFSQACSLKSGAHALLCIVRTL